MAAAKSGAARLSEPSISDGYETIISLRQQHKYLSGDETDRLVASYRDGSTILELASDFGCDRKTVIRYLKLNCVETRYRRLLSEEQIEESAALYEQGMSLAKLGKRFGVDPKTIKARLLARRANSD